MTRAVLAGVVAAVAVTMAAWGAVRWLSAAEQSRSAAQHLVVDYQPWVAGTNPSTKLSVHLYPQRSARGCNAFAYVTFPAAYLANMRVTQVIPPPLSVQHHGTTVAYRFELSPTGHPAQIDFTMEAASWGIHQASITYTGGPPAEFRQWVLPM